MGGSQSAHLLNEFVSEQSNSVMNNVTTKNTNNTGMGKNLQNISSMNGNLFIGCSVSLGQDVNVSEQITQILTTSTYNELTTCMTNTLQTAFSNNLDQAKEFLADGSQAADLENRVHSIISNSVANSIENITQRDFQNYLDVTNQTDMDCNSFICTDVDPHIVLDQNIQYNLKFKQITDDVTKNVVDNILSIYQDAEADNEAKQKEEGITSFLKWMVIAMVVGLISYLIIKGSSSGGGGTGMIIIIVILGIVGLFLWLWLRDRKCDKYGKSWYKFWCPKSGYSPAGHDFGPADAADLVGVDPADMAGCQPTPPAQDPVVKMPKPTALTAVHNLSACDADVSDARFSICVNAAMQIPLAYCTNDHPDAPGGDDYQVTKDARGNWHRNGEDWPPSTYVRQPDPKPKITGFSLKESMLKQE